MTVGGWMAVAIAAALVFTVARVKTVETRLQIGIALVILIGACARLLILILYAKRCTVCGKGPVGLVTAVPFGDHYYRCSACGQRSKRYWMGRLWDASGVEDDRHFAKGRPVETWPVTPIAPAPDRPETRTVGNLLVGKLDRDAEAPHGPIPLGVVPPSESDEPLAIPAGPVGVPSPVTERLERTLELIRWGRRSRQ